MKILFAVLMLLTVFATPCFAGSCQDARDAANAAILERNGRVADTHDILLPDPETERGPLANCLSVINGIGGAFSLGVTIPSMDQIIEGLCKQVDSMIQQKINEVLNEAHNTVGEIGKNNPFKVYGTGGNYVLKMTGKLK